MAGKPAARLGDTAMNCGDPADAPTGTVIAAGTVLINNMPAAKQGDKVVGVDVHIIMIPTPGGPVPTPLPHPFNGMIDGETISSVLIGGMPAAVVGSTASNVPPHIPQGGPFQKPPTNKAKIMIGSPNVLIGEGSGGGGGDGGTGGSTVAATALAVEIEEGHFLDAKFVDKGGKPITGLHYKLKDPAGNESSGVLTEKILQKGLTEGDCEIKLLGIKSAAWSQTNANVGDKVKLTVETIGLDDGEEAELEIFVIDSGFADKSFKKLPAKVDGDKVEIEWEFEVDEGWLTVQEDKKRKYSSPAYYFVARIGDIISRSNVLKYQDWIELELKDEDGNAVGGAEYSLHLPTGQIKKGNLDNNGYAKVEDIPPGKIKVTYDVRKGNSK